MQVQFFDVHFLHFFKSIDERVFDHLYEVPKTPNSSHESISTSISNIYLEKEISKISFRDDFDVTNRALSFNFKK